MPPLAMSTEGAGRLPPACLGAHPVVVPPSPQLSPTQPATFGLHNHSHRLWGKMRCYSLNSNLDPTTPDAYSRTNIQIIFVQ